MNDPDFTVIDSDEFALTIRRKDGHINISKVWGDDADVYLWREAGGEKDIQDLARMLKVPEQSVANYTCGGEKETRGIYLHPALALSFIKYVSFEKWAKACTLLLKRNQETELHKIERSLARQEELLKKIQRDLLCTIKCDSLKYRSTGRREPENDFAPQP